MGYVSILQLTHHSDLIDTYRGDITFLIDNEWVGHYAQQYISGQNGTQYNVLLYSNNSLSFDTHNLTIQVGGTSGLRTLLLLDYVVYT